MISDRRTSRTSRRILALRDDERERGASAIVVAMVAVLLVSMVAVAVDGGLGFNERRQAQSGADFGVLSAALLSNYPGSTPSECSGLTQSLQVAGCKGAVEAMEVVQGNLPDRQIDWSTCVDPITDVTSEFHPDTLGFSPQVRLLNGSPDPSGALTVIDCIHYSFNTHKARVAVPTISLETNFARLMGFDQLSISAVAEAGGTLPEESKVLPFAIPANADTTYDCLKTGPNPDWGPCATLPAVGNFGYADIPVYGVEELGTLPQADGCNPNNQSLVSNMVRGIDHNLTTHPNGVVAPGHPALRDDLGTNTADRTFVCPVWPGNANEIALQTGVVSGAFETGIIWGYGASERGTIYNSAGTTVRNPGGGNPATILNNEPLWAYLNAAGDALCGTPAPSTTPEMVTCLNNWDAVANGVIFEGGASGMRYADRFGYAPKLHDIFGSQTWYLIEDLVPIYINTTYFGCSSGGGGGAAGQCSVIYSPGETGPACAPVPAATPKGSEPLDGTCGVIGNGSAGLAALTTYILQPGMLPDDAKLPFTSDGPLVDIYLTD